MCGPSGSGKSTLIKTVNGLEPIQQGEIFVNDIQVNNKLTLQNFALKLGWYSNTSSYFLICRLLKI